MNQNVAIRFAGFALISRQRGQVDRRPQNAPDFRFNASKPGDFKPAAEACQKADSFESQDKS